MVSPDEAIQFLHEQCQKGKSATVKMAALSEQGAHPELARMAEICGSADIYPGQGNEIAIPKQLFLSAREALRLVLQGCVGAGAELQSGIHTLVVFPRQTPSEIRALIMETETLIGAFHEVTDPLLDQHYFGND